MRKLKTKILSVVAMALIVAGGLFVQDVKSVDANTSAEPAFKMVLTSVRAPSASEATGIRFTANLTDVAYNAYVEEYGEENITAGMFILPKNWYNIQPLTVASIGTKYYWAIGEGEYSVEDTTNKGEILQVESELYKKNDDDTFYTLNGSVVNIFSENLLLDYMGVGYLKLEKDGAAQYVLADTKTDNARTPIQIAETALDTNALPEYADAIETNYIDAYVDWYTEQYDKAPTVTYTENVYLQTKDGYTKTSEEKTVEYTGYGAEVTTIEAKKDNGNYIYSTHNAENVTTATLSLTKKSETNLYYNYVGNKYMILDFEGANITEQLNGGAHNDAGCAAISDTAADGLNSMIVYTGNSWVGHSNQGASYEKVFPTSINRVSMMVKTGTDFTFAISFRFVYADGTVDWFSASKALTASEEWQKVTFELTKEVAALRAAQFQVGGVSYYVDEVYGEYDFTVEDAVLPHDYQAPSAEISFNAPTKIWDSALFPEELVGVTYKAEYKPTTATEYSQATLSGNTFTFTAENSQDYDVKITATLGDKTHVQEHVVYVKDPNLVLDFEGSDPFCGGVSYTGAVVNTTKMVTREDGSVWASIAYRGEQGWSGFSWDNGLDLGTTNVYKLEMDVYSAKAYSGVAVEFKTSTTYGGKWPHITVDILEGTNKLVLDFTTTTLSTSYELNGMSALIFQADSNKPIDIYIDNVRIVTE